jgi:hypothetical protein
LKESVVGDDYQRVDLCPKAFNSRFGLFAATTRLEAKGRSDNTDGERTYRFRNSRDNGRTAGSGSATFACCDENEVRAGEAFFNFGCVVFRGATADFGVGASTETTGQLPSNVEFDVGVAEEKCLCIGVYRDVFDTLDLGVNHSIDSIDTTATYADNLNDGEVIVACGCHGFLQRSGST